MMHTRRLAAIGLLLAVLSCSAFASQVAGILTLGSTSRSLGVGGAFAAHDDSATAVGHNPAGLAWGQEVVVSSLVARDFGIISYGAITIALPHVGFSVLQLDSGDIPTQAGTLRYVSRALLAGIAARLGPVALGVRGKLYLLSMPAEADGWAIDPALLVVTEIVQLGLILENAATRAVRFADGHLEVWTRSVTVGVAASVEPFEDARFTALLEGRGLFGPSPVLRGGLELVLGPMSLRGGYNGHGFTFGLGVAFSSYTLDWAYADHPDLGGSHRASVTFRF